MKLKPPQSNRDISPSGNSLQKEIADRVTKRWEDNRRKKRRAALIEKVKGFLSFCVLCGIAGGAYYAWRSGLLDKWYGGFSGANDESPISVAESDDSRGIVNPQVPSAPQIGQKRDSLDLYLETARFFNDVRIDYWRNALDSDRPDKSKVPLDFFCLIPDENGKPLILKLVTKPGSKMKISQVSPALGLINFPNARFKLLSGRSPYLIVRERRAYLSESGMVAKRNVLPMALRKDIDPAEIVLGPLYDVMHELKVPSPAFRYKVLFKSKADTNPIEIAVVDFGSRVSREAVAEKVARKLGLDKVSESVAIDAVIQMGEIIVESM